MSVDTEVQDGASETVSLVDTNEESSTTTTTSNYSGVVMVGDNEVIDGNGATYTNTSFCVTGNNVVLSNFQVNNDNYSDVVIDTQLFKKAIKNIKTSDDEWVFINMDNLLEYEDTGAESISEWGHFFLNAENNKKYVIDLGDYPLETISVTGSARENITVKIIANNLYGIDILSVQNITLIDSYLPNTILCSRSAKTTVINSTILALKNHKNINRKGGYVNFEDSTIIVKNDTHVIAADYQGWFDAEVYGDIFDTTTNLLKDLEISTLIIRENPPQTNSFEHPFDNPMIINKPININGICDSTYKGDITFIKGSEGSNITNLILNGTVYINTTDIGLYNNTINKGVILTDSGDSKIENNTFNTEDVAITLTNTLTTSIKNNEINSQAEYAIVVDENSLENVITGNSIPNARVCGDFAISADTSSNTVENNLPEMDYTLTDETYPLFFDENGVLKTSLVPNGTVLTVSGEFNENTYFIIDNAEITLQDDGTALINNGSIITKNGAKVIVNGLKIVNGYTDYNKNNNGTVAIYFESEGNILNNTHVFVASDEGIHAVEIIGDNLLNSVDIWVRTASVDVDYDKDNVGTPKSSALYISSSNNLVEDSLITFDGNLQRTGNFPSIDGIDIVSGGKGVIVENNTIRNSYVVGTASDYVYGINIARAKNTLLDNVLVSASSSYYVYAIQLTDVNNITITGIVKSDSYCEAYGVYSTAMGVGSSNGIFVKDANVTVDAPIAKGVLIEGSSNIELINSNYNISAESATAVEVRVDWNGNIPNNTTIANNIINITTSGDANVLYFGNTTNINVVNNTINANKGSSVLVNVGSGVNVTDNYILIGEILDGTFGNYAVESNADDTVIENNTPVSKLVEDLKEQIDELQKELDALKAPKNTTITLDEITNVKYTNNVTISGILFNDEGITLTGQTVVINVNGKDVELTTRNGEFKYITVFKTLGEQTVTVTYAGNDKYTGSDATITFDVEKQDTIIALDDIESVAYGDNVIVTGTLTDINGRVLTSTNVVVTVNGKSVKAKTDSTGVFTASVKAGDVGEQTVTVTYAGNAKYAETEATATFTVDKQDVIITVDPISEVGYGSNAIITGTVTDANGKALVNTNVKVSVNGKTYTAKTDSTGAFSVSVLANAMGTLDVTVSYAGNIRYAQAEATATFTVVEQDVELAVTSAELVDGTVSISGTFKDANGKALTNSNVVVTINGKRYNVKTDSTGTFTYTGQTTESSVTFTLSYAGNARFNAITTDEQTLTQA